MHSLLFFLALNRRQFIPQDFSTMDSGRIILPRCSELLWVWKRARKKNQKWTTQPFIQTLSLIIGFKSDCVPLSINDPPSSRKKPNWCANMRLICIIQCTERLYLEAFFSFYGAFVHLSIKNKSPPFNIIIYKRHNIRKCKILLLKTLFKIKIKIEKE